MRRFMFHAESPWAGCELDDEAEFEDDVTDQEIEDAYSEWIHENFPGSMQEIEAEQFGSSVEEKP